MAAHLKDLSDKGEAVGVHATGGKANEGVPLLDPAAIDDCLLLHGSHRKPSHVVLASLVEAGHLRGLLSKRNMMRLLLMHLVLNLNRQHFVPVLFP